MSYIQDQIAKWREESPEYRAAYDEEVEQTALDTKRRQELMAAVSAVRKSRHVSQHQVAAAMKISPARVSQIERGLETVSVDRLLEMLAAFQGSIAILSAEDVEKYGLQSKVLGGADHNSGR